MPLMPTNRGYTAWNPSDPSAWPPRLLGSHKAAHLALRAWLLGEWEADYESNDSPFGSSRTKIGASPPRYPDPNRKAEEMEIVSLQLTEVK